MKVLFCGLGSIGQRHLRNLLKMQADGRLPFCEPLEILAYRARGRQIALRDDLSVEEGVNLEDKYNIRVFRVLDEALTEQPDVVFITNPMSMHMETMRAVVDKTGADIFVEKPLAHSMEGVRELTARVKEQGRTVFVGFQMRFHPCIRKAKELIDSETIGDIIAANIELGEYMPGTRKYEDYRESCAVKKELGGGVMIAQTHEIDYACCLFGKPRSVYALGGKLSHLEIDVEDTASIILGCERGGAVFPVHLHMDFLQNPATRQCKIIGTHGKIEFDLLSPGLICYNGMGTVIAEDDYKEFQRNDMFIEELDTFFRICRKEAVPVLDMEEGTISLEIALAARESMETGTAVKYRL